MTPLNVNDIKNVESEAGIVASAINNPELTFYSEQLKPNHFTIPKHAYLYYAVSELAKRNIEKIDAYNILNMLSLRKGTEHFAEALTAQEVNEIIEISKTIARNTVEEYRMLVKNVLDAAFRRDTFNRLSDCQRLCFNASEQDIEHKIYEELDSVMLEFSTTSEVPQYKDVVEDYWHEIEARQRNDGQGVIPFKFKTLNSYLTIERGELIIFGAEAKQGKSMMLLNIAADLLKKGYKVLYLDSELNSRLFTCRLVSHLTGIRFKDVRAGRYSQEEHERILRAIEWLKTRTFTHLYMPYFDEQSIYTTVKKVYHQSGIDVLIVDYFKGADEKDAFASYQSLGGLVDLVKNKIAGDMNIAAVGAAQATATGKLADSAKIARNASSIIMIQDKSQDEVEADGVECGNKKLFVKFNRNGPQMVEGEYIDMQFDGDYVSYEEADRQHIPETPY